jgi:hypothetical protein
MPDRLRPAPPRRQEPSLTIPIWRTDPAIGEQVLQNIRHRLWKPFSKGDKYPA